MKLRSRRGFTLAELIVTVVILAVLGSVITRFILVQSNAFATTAAQRSARAVARASMNLLLSELRMVNAGPSAPGSVQAAAADGRTVKVRVPYRYGLVCSASAANMVVSMLPADSMMTAQAVYAGYAWHNRDAASAAYTVVPSTSAPAASAEATCTGTGAGQPHIRTLTINGRSGGVYQVTPGDATAKQGALVFFWQEVTYAFTGSSAYPGQKGLWRQPTGGANEELLAPFDTSARFRYYVSPWSATKNDTSWTSPPAVLDSIRGFELVLDGLSASYAGARSATVSQKSARLVTSVFFRNRTSF